MANESSEMALGELTEEDSYFVISDKEDLFNFLSLVPTDKQKKFLRSVMDGNVKFVKNALNQGSLRNNQALMRTAVNLTCRFGQPQVLDTLIGKLNHDFFKIDNLSFVMVMIAGICEAKRFKTIKEPSGVLDVLIKYGKKSFDKNTRKYINGKIDFETPKLCEGRTNTAFMKLCAVNDKEIEQVVKILIDSHVVDVDKVYDETFRMAGVTPLKRALFTGTKEVVKLLLNKMTWKNYEDLGDFDQNHIQRLLGDFIYDASDHSMSKKYPLLEREDRMDMMELLIEKCFGVTEENKIGHNNDTFMEMHYSFCTHDHFDAMIFSVIEEERRVAYMKGKITWYDMVVKKETHGDGFKLHNVLNDDQLDRYYRTIGGEAFKEKYDSAPVVSYKKGKCWFCDTADSPEEKLLKCQQCKEAHYCDETCQKEDWVKHKAWCQEQKRKLDMVSNGPWKDSNGKTKKEIKKLRKRAAKVVSDGKADINDYY